VHEPTTLARKHDPELIVVNPGYPKSLEIGEKRVDRCWATGNEGSRGCNCNPHVRLSERERKRRSPCEGASFATHSIQLAPCHSHSIMSPHLDVIPADNDASDAHNVQQVRDSNPGLRLALDLRGALAGYDDNDDDADTASPHSISFTSSSAASPQGSPNASEFPAKDKSHRRSNPHTISTESSEDPDDSSLFNERASSVTSHGEFSQDEPAKQVSPTPLTAALRNNVYPPPSPGHSSVASLATSTSSYSRKARPESLLLDSSNGPLILGIALVDFNHQVRCHYLAVTTVTYRVIGWPTDTVFRRKHL
jgi:hypothetical protein